MKRKFYFHRQNAPLDSDHVVYVLWVGESVREQRLLTQLVAWSFAHGSTLRSWGEDVDFYLLLEAERVFPSKGLLDFGFIRHDINAKELLFLMENNAFESFEASLTVPKTFFYEISSMNPSKIQRNCSEGHQSRVLSSQRKNLNREVQNEWSIIRFV